MRLRILLLIIFTSILSTTTQGQIDLTRFISWEYLRNVDLEFPTSYILERPSDQVRLGIYEDLLAGDWIAASEKLDSLESAPDTDHYRVHTLIGLKEFNKALLVLDNLQGIQSDPELLLLKIWAELMGPRINESRDDLAAAKDIGVPEILLEYYDACYELMSGRPLRAKQGFIRSLKLDSTFHLAFGPLVDIYFNEGEFELAADVAREGLEMNPDDEQLLIMKIVNGFLTNAFNTEYQEDLDRLISAFPDNPHFRSLRGIVSFELGRNHKALDDFRKAYELIISVADPSGEATAFKVELNYSDRSSLAIESYYDLRSTMSVSEREMAVQILCYSIIGNNDESRELSFEFKKLSDSVLGDYFNLLTWRSSFPPLNIYNSIIAKEPGNTEIIAERADVYLMNAQYDKALEDLELLINNDPNNVQLLKARGRTYIQMKDFRKGYQDLTRCIVLEPGNLEAYYLRSICAFSLGYYNEADKDLQEYISVEPLNSNVLQVLYINTLNIGDTARAVAYLDSAVNSGIYSPTIFSELGKWNIQSSELDRAEMLISRGIQLYPNETDLYFLRGYCFYLRSDFEAAIEDLKYFLQNEESAEGYWYLGQSMVATGNSRGEKYLDRARDLGYTSSPGN